MEFPSVVSRNKRYNTLSIKCDTRDGVSMKLKQCLKLAGVFGLHPQALIQSKEINSSMAITANPLVLTRSADQDL